MRDLPVIFILLASVGCVGSSGEPVSKTSDRSAIETSDQPAPVEASSKSDGDAAESHLHNLIQVSETIYSGSEPNDDATFAELEKRGVKTIVSVDGIRPNIELAKKHGMEYVHIPIGYDGVSESAGAALARVAKEKPGPIYVHCHHGKHRGPAAAAVACMAAGQLNAQQALDYLDQAGTSKDYAGLWRDVENYQPPQPGAELPELVEAAQVDSMAAVMALLSRHFDQLQAIRENDWQTPADHPDVVPVQEALQIEEHFRESNRLLAKDYDEQFQTWLAESETSATHLREALKANDTAAAEEQFQLLGQSCKKCHAAYRN